LGVIFQQGLLVFGRFQTLVGNDARRGRRTGKFAGAAARFGAGCEFLGFGFALTHERLTSRESAYHIIRAQPPMR
jgi:hypothetical protein